MIGKASEKVFSESMIVRRQEAPMIFDITTVCYVLNPDFVLRGSSIFDGRVNGIEVPSERALYIDTLFDFQIAEFFLKSREGIQ